jgi:lipoprotein-anchoring transpeptidase ErfK/SrfK
VVGAGWWFWPRGDAGTAQVSGAAREAAIGAADDSLEPGVPEAVVIEAEPIPPKPDEVLTPIGADRQAAPDSPAEDAEEPAEETTAPTVARDAEDDDPQELPGAPDEDTGERLSANPRINASLQRYQAGKVNEARQELNRMLAISRDRAEQAELRQHLRQIADATVFARDQRTGDPLVDTYTIEDGDYLINIGRQYKVPYEVIMLINGITNPTGIRAGQKIKVPRGPFHAKIHTTEFRMDVYLQDLYLRSFPVGLGADRGTPKGTWVVKERLPNPTYYPPASAEQKRIIPPDDPTNPLGEHWIGLQGTGGDAAGREGYGIHGTIDPGSIGKAVSLGCVRMHNRDVEYLYKLLMPGHSTVATLP